MRASASSVLAAAKDGHLPSSPVFESSDGLARGDQRKHKLAERNGRSSTSAVPDRNHVVSVHRPRVSPASPWKQDPRPRARFEEHRVQRRRIPTLLHRAQSGPEPRGPTPCSSRSNRALWCGASERLDSPPFRAKQDPAPAAVPTGPSGKRAAEVIFGGIAARVRQSVVVMPSRWSGTAEVVGSDRSARCGRALAR
jgi:hypothetical protein